MSKLPYSLCVLSGLTFSLASILTNVLYALGKTEEPAGQALWCSVAVAASVTLAVCPTAFLQALRQRALGGAVVAFLAFLLCGAYSLSGALGSAVGVRLSSEATATDTDGKRLRAQQNYDTAKKELEALKDATGSKALKRKGELSTTLEAASLELSTLGPSKPVNTDALAISTYLALMGFHVEASDLNKWLALLAVLLVEFGGGLSFALASTCRAALATVPILPPIPAKEVPVESPSVDFLARAKQTPQQRASLPRIHVEEAVEKRLLELVAKHPKKQLLTGNRALGRALGVSHVTAGKALDKLGYMGKVQVHRSRTGTLIKIN